jgi:hypothetical protein
MLGAVFQGKSSFKSSETNFGLGGHLTATRLENNVIWTCRNNGRTQTVRSSNSPSTNWKTWEMGRPERGGWKEFVGDGFMSYELRKLAAYGKTPGGRWWWLKAPSNLVQAVTFDLCSEGAWFESWAGSNYRDCGFNGFIQSLQANVEIVPWITLRLPPPQSSFNLTEHDHPII